MRHIIPQMRHLFAIFLFYDIRIWNFQIILYFCIKANCLSNSVIMKYIFLIKIFLVVGILHSQNSHIDSLKIELKNIDNDTTSINLLNNLAYEYKNSNIDSSKFYADRALTNSKKLKYLPGEARSNFILASANFYSANYDSAMIYANEAKRIYQRLNKQKDIIRTDIIIGSTYERLNDVNNALKSFKNSLKYAKIVNDTKMQINLLSNIGAVYNNRNEYEKALKYYLDALDLTNKTGKNPYLEVLNYNIGFVYENLNDLDKALNYYNNASGLNTGNIYLSSIILSRTGSIYENKGQYQKAIDIELKALKSAKELGANENIAEIYIILGKCYTKLNQNNTANKYFQSALNLVKNTGDNKYLASVYYNYSSFFNKNKNHERAIYYLKKAVEINDKNNYMHSLAVNYLKLAESYKKLNNYKLSNDYYSKYIHLNDSLLAQDNIKKIYELESKFRLREKEDSLALQKAQLEIKNTKLSRQKILNITISFIAVLLLTTLILAYLNIKRRKKINEKLKSLDKAKSRFFANISHELRTPLTLIMAPLENLIAHNTDKSKNDDLEIMKTNSEKILTLIDEIMDISKLESGKLTLCNTTVNLYELTKRIFFSFQSLANFRQLETYFKYEIDKNLTLELDVDKFEKILNNLLSNAFKYSTSGGKVSMIIRKIDEKISIEISDKGIGIKKDDIPKIFNRFYQSHNKPVLGGTGIGLSIAKEYAKAINGDITVDSIINRGSTFTFTFIPVISNKKIKYKENLKENTSLSKKDKQSNKSYTTGPNILIVEDDIEMNKYLQSIIAGKYNFQAVPNGKKAIEVLKKENIDLIVSDLMMPNIDGFELKKIIQSNSSWKRIPFIMLTARSMDEDKLKGFMLGVDDYITKPFNVKELLARIKNLLINKKNRDKWEEENPDINKITVEDKFIKKAEKIILKNIDNSDFSVNDLANNLNYSRRQLERVLKKHTGYTPNEFIREIRLQKAYKLIKARKYSTVLEVSYEVGMENLSYFSQKFTERFGTNPGKMLK